MKRFMNTFKENSWRFYVGLLGSCFGLALSNHLHCSTQRNDDFFVWLIILLIVHVSISIR